MSLIHLLQDAFLKSPWQAISSVILAIFMPQIHRGLNRPRVALKLYGPDIDNGESYWRIQIQNNGGVVNNAALYLVAIKAIGVEQDIPMVRFEWPYECNGLTGEPQRSIVKLQQVDLFSTENGGKLHLKFYGTRFNNLPSEGNYIDIAVQLIGQNYQSKKKWLRITNENTSWHIKELSNYYLLLLAHLTSRLR